MDDLVNVLRAAATGTARPEGEAFFLNEAANRIETLEQKVTEWLTHSDQQKFRIELAQARAERLEEMFRLFANAVEKRAFEMPAPNQYTPIFVQLVVEARAALAEQKAPKVDKLCGQTGQPRQEP